MSRCALALRPADAALDCGSPGAAGRHASASSSPPLPAPPFLPPTPSHPPALSHTLSLSLALVTSIQFTNSRARALWCALPLTASNSLALSHPLSLAQKQMTPSETLLSPAPLSLRERAPSQPRPNSAYHPPPQHPPPPHPCPHLPPSHPPHPRRSAPPLPPVDLWRRQQYPHPAHPLKRPSLSARRPPRHRCTRQ